MITFKWVKLGIKKRVFLENKHVGDIIREREGWKYYPKGRKGGGDPFPTLTQCEKSLMED